MALQIIVASAGLLLCLNCSGIKAVPSPSKENLYQSVKTLSVVYPNRNAANPAVLDRCAGYIRTQLKSYGYEPAYQEYTVNQTVYRNVTAVLNPNGSETIVVGAHYDVAGYQPGADDNASGVAGLLELARILKQYRGKIKYKYIFVAYSLEEPPFFRTNQMGSFIHAKSLKKSRERVKLMISLETIGFYSDQKGSQRYPVKWLSRIYPDKGNFIALAGSFYEWQVTGRIKSLMLKYSGIPVESLNAGRSLEAVDRSDHLNYWKMGYRAIMVTDTANFRNPNYHMPTDTIDTLDFERMTEVIRGMSFALIRL